MSSALVRLRFIHCAGWIVFGRLPGPRTGTRRNRWRPRPSMVFLSDYDGDPTEYLAAFGLAVTSGMRWSFGPAEHFPGPRPTPPFVRYVERRSVEPLIHHSAYPQATVRDIDTALAAAERLDELLRSSETEQHDRLAALVRSLSLAPEPSLPSGVSGIVQTLLRRSTVRGLATVMPLDPTRQQAALRTLAATGARTPSVFENLPGLHFARMAALPVAGRSRSDDRPGEVREHLLFSAWFDGSTKDFVDRLVAHLPPETSDDLWGGCIGYPGASEPDQLKSWILSHRLGFSLFFDSRSDISAEEIQAALALREQITQTVTSTAGQPPGEIRRALAALTR